MGPVRREGLERAKLVRGRRGRRLSGLSGDAVAVAASLALHNAVAPHWHAIRRGGAASVRFAGGIAERRFVAPVRDTSETFASICCLGMGERGQETTHTHTHTLSRSLSHTYIGLRRLSGRNAI